MRAGRFLRRARERRACAGAVVLSLILLGGCAPQQAKPVTQRPPTRPQPAPQQRTYAPPPPPARTYTPPSVVTERTVEVGRSVRGAPIQLHIFGNGPDRVFIFGGIHGSEPTSAALARQLLAHLRSDPTTYNGRTVGIMAEANPDGLRAGTRGNANGVDLNRNFPAKNWKRSPQKISHGTQPLSEPETNALVRAMGIVSPRRVVSIHSTHGGKFCNNYDGPARAHAELMARHNRYPPMPTWAYPTPGSFGSWAGVDRGIPVVTLELPRGATAATVWRDNREALLAFIRSGG